MTHGCCSRVETDKKKRRADVKVSTFFGISKRKFKSRVDDGCGKKSLECSKTTMETGKFPSLESLTKRFVANVVSLYAFVSIITSVGKAAIV